MQSHGPQVSSKEGDGLRCGDAGVGASQPRSLPAGSRKRAVREMAVLQSQQQKRVSEDEEGGGRSHGSVAANLRLAKAEQSFFVAEVEFNLPAPKIRLQNLLGRQGRVGANQIGRISIVEMCTFASPVGDGADDEQFELSFAACVFPAQWGDAFDLKVVDVTRSEGPHLLPRPGFLTTTLLRSGQALAVAATASTSVVFLCRGGQGVETRVFANTADQNRTRRQMLQHGAVGEGGIGTDQQRARGATWGLIHGVSQMREAFRPTPADDGSSRGHPPVVPQLGIGTA